MSLLAIDIGSTTCKAVAFATSGKLLAQHSTCYTPEFPRALFAEMNPRKFWDALCGCCQAVSRGLTDPVQALAISSHGESFVPVDCHGEALSNVILNQDGRATEEATFCEQVMGRQRLFQVTGLFPHPMYPIPKMLWLRKNEPKLFASTCKFVTVVGYLLQRMGLPACVDESLASRYMAFDVSRRCWSGEVLDGMELDESQLPLVVPAGAIAGYLAAEPANRLGVPVGTAVVVGGHDQPCGALGAGVTGGGRVCDSMGTYECLVAASDAPILTAAALNASLNSYCHVVPDKFVTLAYFPSGIMVKWLHDLLYAEGAEEMPGEKVLELEAQRYAALEASAPEGPSGVCVTPHLIGTCNPEFNPRVRAAISGITPSTNRARLYKGVLEGLACELSIMTKLLAQAVGSFEEIRVFGGGTRSALGLRLRAAIAGHPLHVMKHQEAVCLGTAILAGVAVGEFSGFEEAVNQLVKESAVVSPDMKMASSYREPRKRYQRLRSAAVRQA